MKLIITIPELDHIPKDDLDKWGYESELDYYIDLLHSDPPILLDKAFYELCEKG